MSSTTPTLIRRSDPEKLEIQWEDGHWTRYRAADLRRMCPCAQCVDELTGVRRLDPGTVPDALTQHDTTLVGNYALAMRFSDGHHTGIYSFRFLRENDPAG